MRQLTSLDAQFLALETARQSGHVAGLAMLDPSTAPGGTLTVDDIEEQLAEQVARIVSRPLDRSRPLWELYLVHGHESGDVAMLTKIHHAVIDGMSGAEVMGLLLDLSPEGRELPPARAWGADRAPGDLEMLARGLLGVPRYPLRLLRSLPRTMP